MVKLVINLEPKPQTRPFFSRKNGKQRTFDRKPIVEYKHDVLASVKTQYKGAPMDKPIKMTVKFYKKTQKGGSKATRQAKEDGLILPAIKPDIDNMFKAITDAMNGYVYTDDNLICEVHMYKFYSKNPRTEIEIEEIGG